MCIHNGNLYRHQKLWHSVAVTTTATTTTDQSNTQSVFTSQTNPYLRSTHSARRGYDYYPLFFLLFFRLLFSLFCLSPLPTQQCLSNNCVFDIYEFKCDYLLVLLSLLCFCFISSNLRCVSLVLMNQFLRVSWNT